jgi:hypothetical protein
MKDVPTRLATSCAVTPVPCTFMPVPRSMKRTDFQTAPNVCVRLCDDDIHSSGSEKHDVQRVDGDPALIRARTQDLLVDEHDSDTRQIDVLAHVNLPSAHAQQGGVRHD